MVRSNDSCVLLPEPSMPSTIKSRTRETMLAVHFHVAAYGAYAPIPSPI